MPVSARVERYKTRQQARTAARRQPALVLLPSPASAARLARMEEDSSYVDAPRIAAASPLPEPDVAEAALLLEELSASFERGKFQQTMAELKTSVLQNIAGPFGVGKLLSAYDKTGGAVNTVHNARQGVYATEAEAQRYAQREAYDSDAYHQHQDYIAANRKVSAGQKAGTLEDSYTGETFAPGARHDPQRKATLDHVVAAKNVHDDAGRVLAELDGPGLANIGANLEPTAASVNYSKKTSTAAQFSAKLAGQAPARKARMAELAASKAQWSDKERKEYARLEALDKVDPKRLADKEAQAQREIDARINSAYYGSAKFARAAATAGATEGAKMGVQQALGTVLVEFFAAVFDEIGDLYRQGRREESLIKEARVRLGKIARRVGGKWKAALAALGQGFLSGLLSSLVTTLVNAFVTTGKNLVRIIREGFLSLLRALKLLLFRPKNMSRRQALHEASKIVVGAGVTVGGIALEEVVGKYMAALPGLGLVAGPATAAIVGSLTAIATTFAVYMLDQADLFGVNAQARTEAVCGMLDQKMSDSAQRIEAAHTRMLALARV
ncbi:hypothetical protein ACLB1G_11965 [Oxalobacteraceae bacterium A2-2]